MTSYAQAVELVRGACKPLPPEELALGPALGRFVGSPMRALNDSPPFDSSSVDGFALGPGGPKYRVVADIFAGVPESCLLGSNEAARISTGAPIPPGTVAIEMLEECSLEGDFVTARGGGDFIRPRGEDFRAGQELLSAGDLLTPIALGVLASAGHSTVSVHRRPRVGLLTTGSELVAPGEPLGPGQIYDSATPCLASALKALGVEVVARQESDSPEATRQAVAELLAEIDVLITCGGVSVGPHDHLKEAFRDASVHEVFWRVAIKPGKPLFFGSRGGQLVFGLPGNPVSSLVTFLLFVRPAIFALMGARSPWPETREATLGSTVNKSEARTEFIRGRTTPTATGLEVTPLEGRASNLVYASSQADCLIVFPEEATELHAGTRVATIPVRWGSP